jgi:hypothetical protein
MQNSTSLNVTNPGKAHECSQADCANCSAKGDMLKRSVTSQTESHHINIFQRYYEALLQGYSADLYWRNEHAKGIHST